jgi:hypothetical protein
MRKWEPRICTQSRTAADMTEIFQPSLRDFSALYSVPRTPSWAKFKKHTSYP